MNNAILTPADWAKLERSGLVRRPEPFTDQMSAKAAPENARKLTPANVSDQRRENRLSGDAWMTPARKAWLERMRVKRAAGVDQHVRNGAWAAKAATTEEAARHINTLVDAAPKCCRPGCKNPAKFNARYGRYIKTCADCAERDSAATRIREGKHGIVPVQKPRERSRKGMLQILDLIDRKICAKVPLGQSAEQQHKRAAYDDCLAIVREARKAVEG